jgi:hypothetical protein
VNISCFYTSFSRTLLQPKTGKNQNPKISNLVLSNLLQPKTGKTQNPKFSNLVLSNLLQPKTGKNQNPKISNLVLSNLKISKYHGQTLNPHFKGKKNANKKIPVQSSPPLNSTQPTNQPTSQPASQPPSDVTSIPQTKAYPFIPPPPLRGRLTVLRELFSGLEEKGIS